MDLAGKGFVGEAGGLSRLGTGQALTLTIEHKVLIVDERHSVSRSELFSSGSDEVDVGALFEDQSSCMNGVTQALDTGNASGLHAASVHEESIKLYASVGGEEASPAGIERGIVFENDYRGLNGIECGATAGENGVSGIESIADAGFVSGSIGCGDGPCSAVHEESRNVFG